MSPWILSRSRVSGGVAGGAINDVAEVLVVERAPGADMFKLQEVQEATWVWLKCAIAPHFYTATFAVC